MVERSAIPYAQAETSSVSGFLSTPLYTSYEPAHTNATRDDNGEKGRAERLIEQRNCAIRERNTRADHRKRTYLFAALVVVLLAAAFSNFLISNTADANERYLALQSEHISVTVTPGDTIWGICESHPVKGMTTYELVQHVIDSNNIASSEIHPGDVLTLPTSNV